MKNQGSTSTLRKLFAVRLTDTKPVRGATQHFYASEISGSKTAQGLLQETASYDRAKIQRKTSRKSRR